MLQSIEEYNKFNEIMSKSVETCMIDTARGSEIAVMRFHFWNDDVFTLLLSLPTGWDLGFAELVCGRMACDLPVNVVTYDYTGYGASSGKPSRKNMYSDIDAVLKVSIQALAKWYIFHILPASMSPSICMSHCTESY